MPRLIDSSKSSSAARDNIRREVEPQTSIGVGQLLLVGRGRRKPAATAA
jgi:hypothetical protein